MTDRRFHLDVESRSQCELGDTNVYVYFSDPTTDLWCAAYAFDEDEPSLWHPGEPCPPEIKDHILSGGNVHAWNANFERIMWRSLLGPKYGWPVPDLRQYRCSMICSYAMALPGKLDLAAPAIGLPIIKDQQGARLMKQMMRPRRPKKGEPTDKLLWWDDPERIRRLGEYAKQDVRTERAMHSHLLALRPAEQEMWFLDQQIADRGVYIDADLCRAAGKIIETTIKRLDRELATVTEWDVTACSNTGQLRTWLASRGVPVDSVAKDAIVDLLARDDLAPDVRRALEIRQEGGKTSTAKIDAMLDRRQADGRMRGNLQYWGATTGRWAARGAQLQNLPRPKLKKGDIAGAIETVTGGRAWEVEILYGPPMQVVSDCIRGMIAAPKGRQIMAADLASIEARVDQWLAGGNAALDAFRLYDRKIGPDPYVVAAAAIYNVPVSEVTERMRLVGKVAVLALGFGGGPAAFAKMAKGYGLDLSDAKDSVWESAPSDSRKAAAEGWKQRGAATGMSEENWTTAELIKLAWRRANPEVRTFWRDLEQGAMEAVESPGRVVGVGATGKIKYKRVGSFLHCQLPSGRAITYPFPRLAMKLMPWENEDGEPVYREALVCKGLSSFNHQWGEYDFYGGLACENVTQAVARDVMAEGMMRLERAGYPVTITIHDEVVTEPEIGFGSLEHFIEVMTQIPVWAGGLLVAAEGFIGSRYRK